MSTPAERPTWELLIVILGGFVTALCGLGMLAGADGWADRFFSSAMVFTGAMVVFPQLVALTIKRYR